MQFKKKINLENERIAMRTDCHFAMSIKRKISMTYILHFPVYREYTNISTTYCISLFSGVSKSELTEKKTNSSACPNIRRNHLHHRCHLHRTSISIRRRTTGLPNWSPIPSGRPNCWTSPIPTQTQVPNRSPPWTAPNAVEVDLSHSLLSVENKEVPHNQSLWSAFREKNKQLRVLID